jgi:hypothetical protein
MQSFLSILGFRVSEEPWLRDQYGSAFENHSSRVQRFP